MIKLNPNQRLLIESWINHYRVVGPGLIWLKPWQKALATLNIGPQGRSLRYEAVRTAEGIPIDIDLKILYRIDPDLFQNQLLPKVEWLNSGGWPNILEWRTESVLRQLVVSYGWRDLSHQPVRKRLERHLTQTLASVVKNIGLNVMTICLVKTELPIRLQKTMVQAEMDGIEARGRTAVLREYLDIFSQDLPQTMQQIVQWELLNMLHKKGDPHLLLTSSSLSLDNFSTEKGEPRPSLQLGLPWPHEGKNGKSEKSK